MAQVRDFSQADDTVDEHGLTSVRVTLGAHSVSRSTHMPGWRWSTHARKVGAPPSCQTHHVGYAISGHLHIEWPDGTALEVMGGSVFDVPPGHDAWVVGDEPYEAIDWVGARSWLAGVRGGSSRLVTILFSDVVDSSGELRRRGDLAWSDLNATLAERTRDLVSEFAGEVLKSTGDGALAVFGSAARAVRCGLDLSAVARHLGVGIRIGVHTGEVQDVDGDVHGITVHEAARIMGVAQGGEVVVSEVTRALAGTTDLEFQDLGDHDLKGIGVRRVHRVTRVR